jgi:hypothetical protein
MNWKQLLFPRPVRAFYKTARVTKNKIVSRFLTRLLFMGWPHALSSYLGSRCTKAQVFLYKQGIFSVFVGDRFLRFASGASGQKLQREYTSWQQLRDKGLASILPRSMELRTEGSGTILETDRLWPIDKEDQLNVTLPIIRELVARARPAPCGIPTTVDAGLRFAKTLGGGSLPRTFADEDEIRDCFARDLLCGPTHQDLHFRNVMLESTGRPVLIDLKSCQLNHPLSISLLTFVCKYFQTRDGRNTIEIAYTAQQRDWRFPKLDPVLSLIDVDRHLWGPLYLLHSIGGWAQKGNRIQNHPSIYGKLVLRILSRNWQMAL